MPCCPADLLCPDCRRHLSAGESACTFCRPYADLDEASIRESIFALILELARRDPAPEASPAR